MQLKTILNRVEKYKSFVSRNERFVESEDGRLTLEVDVVPRAGSRAVCSGCHRKRPNYDRLPPRRFEFVPLWQIAVFFVSALRRVACPQCGVTVEEVPWCRGKHAQTKSYQRFLAQWAKRLSWQEVADVFHTSWQSVFRAVKRAVVWGLAHEPWQGIRSLGVDEIAWRKGHKYLTLMYQIDADQKRLLWVADDRETKSLEEFFDLLGAQRSALLQFVCSDMWKPDLEVIARSARQAVHVLDRYHIMAKMNKAIDEIRAAEAKQLEAEGYEPVLKHSRWCLLKRPENRTAAQTVKMRELLKYNLKSVRAHLQREDFQRFWEYCSPAWAGKFLDEWCVRTLRSRLEPMQKVARMLRAHRDLLLNWFKAEGAISAGTVEGLNNKAKLTFKKAYGFKSPETAKIALFHTLSKLSEPKFTHEFW
jgi:transposase